MTTAELRQVALEECTKIINHQIYDGDIIKEYLLLRDTCNEDDIFGQPLPKEKQIETIKLAIGYYKLATVDGQLLLDTIGLCLLLPTIHWGIHFNDNINGKHWNYIQVPDTFTLLPIGFKKHVIRGNIKTNAEKAAVREEYLTNLLHNIL